jgi:FAD/FMN-containing dehydrogenase
MIIKTNPEFIQHYFEDSSGMLGAHADKVVIAESKEDIMNIMQNSSETATPVTVVGGATGVTGGCLAFAGIILSTERLNDIAIIKTVSDKKAFIKVGAGSLVSDIKNYALKNGWMYPPDPTEKNATIGGNISTNASGAEALNTGPPETISIALTLFCRTAHSCR